MQTISLARDVYESNQRTACNVIVRYTRLSTRLSYQREDLRVAWWNKVEGSIALLVFDSST